MNPQDPSPEPVLLPEPVLGQQALGAQDHPLRQALHDEVHARTGFAVRAPASLLHLAFTLAPGSPSPLPQIVALCAPENAEDAPIVDAKALHFSAQTPFGLLRAEIHGEFYRLTLLKEGADAAQLAFPQAWLEQLPGQRLVAMRTCTRLAQPEGHQDAQARAFFGHDALVGSQIAQGEAIIWTDFRLQPDGYSRVLVSVNAMAPARLGRAVRRIHELETYRMMALLALPLARAIGPQLGQLERDLGEAVNAMTGEGSDDAALLERLGALSRAGEHLAQSTAYRFAASKAYANLVARRLAELNEERLKNHQRIGVFLERRFDPAMASVQACSDRINRLVEGCARAATLLRTRVEIALEAQNQAILHSMNARAQQQLRLQETVEGLSIVAISYYTYGLVAKFIESMEGLGAGMFGVAVFGPLKLGKALHLALIPLIVLAVWFSLHSLKRHALKETSGKDNSGKNKGSKNKGGKD